MESHRLHAEGANCVLKKVDQFGADTRALRRWIDSHLKEPAESLALLMKEHASDDSSRSEGDEVKALVLKGKEDGFTRKSEWRAKDSDAQIDFGRIERMPRIDAMNGQRR